MGFYGPYAAHALKYMHGSQFLAGMTALSKANRWYSTMMKHMLLCPCRAAFEDDVARLSSLLQQLPTTEHMLQDPHGNTVSLILRQTVAFPLKALHDGYPAALQLYNCHSCTTLAHDVICRRGSSFRQGATTRWSLCLFCNYIIAHVVQQVASSKAFSGNLSKGWIMLPLNSFQFLTSLVASCTPGSQHIT